MGRSMHRPHNRTGRQRYYVTFQSPVTTFTGTDKTPGTAWVNGLSVWAEMTQIGGREVTWNQQVQAEEDYIITCRYFPGFKQNMRIMWNDLYFYIIQVNDLGTLNHVIEITCTKMDPEQHGNA